MPQIGKREDTNSCEDGIRVPESWGELVTWAGHRLGPADIQTEGSVGLQLLEGAAQAASSGHSRFSVYCYPVGVLFVLSLEQKTGKSSWTAAVMVLSIFIE